MKHVSAILAVSIAASLPASAHASTPANSLARPFVQSAPTRPAAGGSVSVGLASATQKGKKVTVHLPAGWPKDVALPTGSTLMGGTSSPRRWTVLVVMNGSAGVVLKRANAFYRAHGYRAVTASVLVRPHRQITMVAANRDHSATKTNLVIEVHAT